MIEKVFGRKRFGKIKVYYPFENGKSMTLKFYKDFNTKGIIKREITYSY